MTRTRADDEVFHELSSIVEKYRSKGNTTLVMRTLDDIMLDPERGPEFVRLMQKWMACR